MNSRAGICIPFLMVSSREIGRAPIREFAGLSRIVVGLLGASLPVAVTGPPAIGMTDGPFDQPFGDVGHVEFPEGVGIF